MTLSRHSSKIRPDPLERQAFVYVRQATLFQVRENTASTARQDDLVQRAQNWAGRQRPSPSSIRTRDAPALPRCIVMASSS